MHLFYTPDISSNLYKLSESESKHCIRVLRLIKGDIVYLIDGVGGFYTASIVDNNPKACVVKVVKKQENYGERNYYLHIAIAPTKNIDRFEWFLEKATEIGIDEITPLLCDFSERKIIKPERLSKIITSAVKQSITGYHPKLNPLTKFTDFINKQNDFDKYIAHCYDLPREELKSVVRIGASQLVLIGPEGDFSKDEVVLSEQMGYKTVSLGNSRLRTETAGVVACHTIALIN